MIRIETVIGMALLLRSIVGATGSSKAGTSHLEDARATLSHDAPMAAAGAGGLSEIPLARTSDLPVPMTTKSLAP